MIPTRGGHVHSPHLITEGRYTSKLIRRHAGQAAAGYFRSLRELAGEIFE
jgi:hypothetical protein